MPSPVCKKLILISSLMLLLAPTQASAIDPIGTYRKPKCPPYCGPCFGYFPTRWRPWPTECEVSQGAVVEAAPAPAPAKTERSEEKPVKDKKEATPEDKVPPLQDKKELPPIKDKKEAPLEKAPPPKPGAAQSKSGIVWPAAYGESAAKLPGTPANPPRAWDPVTGRAPELKSSDSDTSGLNPGRRP